jgi:16S rRNA (cytidine1402-2'-O)-methyltransferase
LLHLVPTPIGNIADISLRSLETLQNADVFLCEDTRVTKQLLKILQERYHFDYKQTAQFIPLHSHNEKEFLKNL